MSPTLHWLQPGLTPSPSTGDSITTGALTYTDPFVVDYAGPGPPPGSSPHRYLFLLYEQPAEFDAKKFAPGGKPGKKVGIPGRPRWSLEGFEREAKLGPVVAANYFCSK